MHLKGCDLKYKRWVYEAMCGKRLTGRGDAPHCCLQDVVGIFVFIFFFLSVFVSGVILERSKICVGWRVEWSGAMWRGVEHCSADYGQLREMRAVIYSTCTPLTCSG